jgi:hypothetical protein
MTAHDNTLTILPKIPIIGGRRKIGGMSIHVINEEKERLRMIFFKPFEGRVIQVCGNAFSQVSILDKEIIERKHTINYLIDQKKLDIKGRDLIVIVIKSPTKTEDRIAENPSYYPCGSISSHREDFS